MVHNIAQKCSRFNKKLHHKNAIHNTDLMVFKLFLSIYSFLLQRSLPGSCSFANTICEQFRFFFLYFAVIAFSRTCSHEAAFQLSYLAQDTIPCSLTQPDSSTGEEATLTCSSGRHTHTHARMHTCTHIVDEYILYPAQVFWLITALHQDSDFDTPAF